MTGIEPLDEGLSHLLSITLQQSLTFSQSPIQTQTKRLAEANATLQVSVLNNLNLQVSTQVCPRYSRVLVCALDAVEEMPMFRVRAIHGWILLKTTQC